MLGKYKFTPESGFICLRITHFGREPHCVDYAIVDSMSPQELEALLGEYREKQYEHNGAQYHGLNCDVISLEELPEGFLDSKVKECQADLAHGWQRLWWYSVLARNQNPAQVSLALPMPVAQTNEAICSDHNGTLCALDHLPEDTNLYTAQQMQAYAEAYLSQFFQANAR